MSTPTTLSSRTVPVVGYGALGQEIVTQLLAAGRAVKVIQRSRPRDLPQTFRNAGSASPTDPITDFQ